MESASWKETDNYLSSRFNLKKKKTVLQSKMIKSSEAEVSEWVIHQIRKMMDPSSGFFVPVQSPGIFKPSPPGGAVLETVDYVDALFMMAARQCCPVTTGGRDTFDILTLFFFCPLQQTWQEKERGITGETGKFPSLLPKTIPSSSVSSPDTLHHTNTPSQTATSATARLLSHSGAK